VTTLDQLVAKSMQLTGAPVLFVARHRIRFQSGCGVGRPQYGERVLLIHPKDTHHVRTWGLPDADVVPEEYLDSAVPFGNVLIARCEAEFKPSIDEDKYDVTWTNAEFAVSCAGNHPDATAAIQQFLADSGTSEPPGDLKMDSRKDFVEAQSKADRIFRAYGDSAPSALNGESLIDYRCRLARQFQSHSKQFKGADLSKIGDSHVLTAIEDAIYADAAAALSDPNTFMAGELRAVRTRDPSGREITKYIGRDGACWDQFHPPIRHVTRIMTPGRA
jgi:hypothetical protein